MGAKYSYLSHMRDILLLSVTLLVAVLTSCSVFESNDTLDAENVYKIPFARFHGDSALLINTEEYLFVHQSDSLGNDEYSTDEWNEKVFLYNRFDGSNKSVIQDYSDLRSLNFNHPIFSYQSDYTSIVNVNTLVQSLGELNIHHHSLDVENRFYVTKEAVYNLTDHQKRDDILLTEIIGHVFVYDSLTASMHAVKSFEYESIDSSTGQNERFEPEYLVTWIGDNGATLILHDIIAGSYYYIPIRDLQATPRVITQITVPENYNLFDIHLETHTILLSNYMHNYAESNRSLFLMNSMTLRFDTLTVF